MSTCTSGRSSGFSLVEVALALLVASVGLLSVMGLFPVGLDANRKAIDEAQCALFAEEIFNGFRAKMSLPGQDFRTIESLDMEVPAPDMWHNGDQIRFRANGSGTNIYQYRYEPEMLDYAVRYVMSVDDATLPGVKMLRLTLWNGQYGSTTNPLVFYTEIYDTGVR